MNRIVKDRILDVVHHGLTLLFDNPSTEKLEYSVESYRILCYREEKGFRVDIEPKN